MTVFKKLTAYSDVKCKYVSAIYPYDEENAQLKDENAKLRELVKLAVRSACFGCPHNNKNAWGSCAGCNLYEYSTELGIEVNNG